MKRAEETKKERKGEMLKEEERRIDRGREREKSREGYVREREREIDRGRKRGERVK